MSDLTLEQRLTRMVNTLTWERRFDGLSTAAIVAEITAALGEPERINTIDGEVISAIVVGRSRTAAETLRRQTWAAGE